MKQKKVLILTNPLNHEGGIVNYYNLFFKHFKSEKYHLLMNNWFKSLFVLLSCFKRLLYPFYYLFDVFVYVLKLVADQRIKIIQVSPSLIPVPLIRDGVLILLAKLFGKVVIFYRGWKLPTYK